MEVAASLSLSFLGAESAGYEDPITGTNTAVQWHFDTARTSLPLELAQCSIRGFGLEAVGHGDGMSRKIALRRAFCEAWERLWFWRVVAGQVPHFSYSLNTTNGFASGVNSEDALRRSRSEAMERAALLEAWQSMTGWHPLRPSLVLRAAVRALPKSLSDWRWRYFLIRARGMPDTHVLFAQHPTEGMVVDAVGGDASAFPDAKLATSVLRTIALPEPERGLYQLADLPKTGTPQDHGRLYRNPDHFAAFQFLEGNDARGELRLPPLEGLQSKVLTPPSNFPAVAVSFHPDWPVLRWGRESIQGRNPWPHPLA